MRWFAYILLSIVIAVFGLFGAGIIGNEAVRWHRVSNFEGKAGFAVIGWAVAGAIVSFLVGLVVMGIVGPREGAAYVRAMGIALAVLTVLGGGVAWISRASADIPPELDGRPLVLEVEVKLPVTVQAPPPTNDARLCLYALIGDTRRGPRDGRLMPDAARLEAGRWIVPGSVELFTTRGRPAFEAHVHGLETMGFLISMPARPGPDRLEWSDWLPRPPEGNPPWPDTKASYRFRVQKVPAPAPPPTAEQVKAEKDGRERARFEAVPDDAPVEAWFPFVGTGGSGGLRKEGLAKLTGKPAHLAELGGLMVGPDPELAMEAMRLVEHLPVHPPELKAAVRAAGIDIAERIRKGNQVTAEADPAYRWAADVSLRFHGWIEAIRAFRKTGADEGTSELRTILELSRVRPDSIAMRSDVCRVASHYMKEWAGLEPLPTDPRPR